MPGERSFGAPVARITAEKPSREQLLERDVPPDADAGADLDAHRGEEPDLVVDDRARQPVLRDAAAQQAAGERLRLEDGHAIAEAAQLVGGREPGGPGADDRDPLGALDGRRRPGERRLLRELEVGGVALEPADRDRLVDLAAAARGLAGVRADPAADAGERVALAHEGERLAVAPLRDQRDVALRVDADRAGRAAGRPPRLRDPRDLRAEVGGRQRHGAPAREPGRGREVDGADRNAFAAGGAARRVDRLRPHPHPRRQPVAVAARSPRSRRLRAPRRRGWLRSAVSSGTSS